MQISRVYPARNVQYTDTSYVEVVDSVPPVTEKALFAEVCRNGFTKQQSYMRKALYRRK